jgi:hypothetical protein
VRLEASKLSARCRMQAAGDDQPRVSPGQRGGRADLLVCLGHRAGQSGRACQRQLRAAERRAGEGGEVAVRQSVGHQDVTTRIAEHPGQRAGIASHVLERQERHGPGGATADDLDDIGGGSRIRGILPDGRLVGGRSAHQEHAVHDRSALRGKGGTEERRPPSARREKGLQFGADRAS